MDERDFEARVAARLHDRFDHAEPSEALRLRVSEARGVGTPRVRRSRSLWAAAAAAALIVGAVVAVWANRPTSTAVVGGSPSPAATATASPSASSLAEHESILQMHRTATGGWLLTGSRLLVTDGSNWRDCWRSTGGDVTSPYLRAGVAGDVIRVISGTTLWTSTDGCASWAESALPIAATGVAFLTDSTGYIAVGEQSGSNQETRIFRTDDAGQHWAAIPGKVKAIVGPYDSAFYGNLTLAFADADHGWLTDTHTLWTTANGGRTWARTILPVPGSVHGELDFIATPVVGVDGSAAVAAKYDATPGMDGAPGRQVFYRTVDRGVHWTAMSIVEDPGMLALSLVDPTTWVVLDPSDSPAVRATNDAGSSWQTIAVRERWPFNSGPIDFADSRHGWMVVSEPYPPCPQPSGMPGTMICDYAYAPPQHLVATDDGGATWLELKP